MAETVRIDFVSDVVCPWCVVGLRGLQIALDRLDGVVDADIHLQPFELNPDMAPEGENTTEHIQKKYGSSRDRSDATRNALKQAGETLGFAFNYNSESRIWNTFDAHRLLHWAETEAKALELKSALLKANFTDQRDISDRAVLADVAGSVGLDVARAKQILDSDAYVDDVRADETLWRSRGINAVPAVIINQRWLIQGGQPPEVFEQALRQVVSGTATIAE